MVQEYALIITEDVMRENGKTTEMLPKLIETLSHYGKVIRLEEYNKVKNGEYQATINSLTAQLTAIEEQKLTADELEIIRAYRVQIARHDADKDKIVAELTKQLETVVAECEQRITRVKQALGD